MNGSGVTKFRLIGCTFRTVFSKMWDSFKFTALQVKWRQRNSHNETKLVRRLRLDKITVGSASYGDLDVYEFGHPDEHLSIGNFVSIAPAVKFILGGGHDTNVFMLYPVRKKYLGASCEADLKGTIRVEDDVWIGAGATILSGVTIGRGSVIGAGSVVVRDIPPYSVAVGIPCRVIRSRFAERVVRKLQQIDLSSLKPETVVKFSDFFTRDLTDISEKELDAFVLRIQAEGQC